MKQRDVRPDKLVSPSYKKAAWVVLLCLTATVFAWGQDVNGKGTKLANLLDSMDVEHLWLSNHYVHWQTGTPRNKPITDRKKHTHCSAFVAAFSAKLGIYILRPPLHSANDLANAQYDWLQHEGKRYEWKRVRTMQTAQQDANHGELVVAVYKATEPGKHGHIAVLRPAEKSTAAIDREGPQITQAGMENFASTTLKQGFRHHKGAWENHTILFFVHRIDWNKVKEDPAVDSSATDDDNS